MPTVGDCSLADVVPLAVRDYTGSLSYWVLPLMLVFHL